MLRLMNVTYFVALIAALFISPVDAKSRSDYEKEAQSFVQGVIKDVYTIVKSSESQNEKEKKFRATLEKNFALEDIAKFSLGRHKKHIDGLMEQYVIEFKRLIVEMYASQFDTYKDAKMPEITGVKFLNNKFQVVSVGKDTKNNNAKVEVIWTVFPTKDGSWQVSDLIIAKISAALSQRRQFNTDFRHCSDKVKRKHKKASRDEQSKLIAECFLKKVKEAADDYDAGTRKLELKN